VTFEEYQSLVDDMVHANPTWRHGQAAYNTLATTRADLAKAVDATDGLDPYYAYLKERW
jgi:hypothetical protein